MKIPILVTPASTLIRPHRSEPVTFGVPLPAGAIRAPQAWTIEAPDGGRSAADIRVLDTWADGSARWILVDAAIDTEPGPPQIWTLDSSGSPASEPAAPAITVHETASGVTVDTGTATFVLARGGHFPLDQVEIAHVPVLDQSGRGGLSITDATGHRVEAVAETITIEHRGRLRCSIRVTASVAAGAGRRLEVEARLDCYAGSAAVRLRCTIRNPDPAVHPGNYWDLGDPGSILLKDVSLDFMLPAGVRHTSIRASAEPGQPWIEPTAAFELYQDSSGGEHWRSTNHINRERRVPTTFRGYRVRADGHQHSGLRATPLVIVTSDERTLAVSMPDCWQNFPRALHAAPAGVAVRFFPEQFSDRHELQGGEQKTHDCFVGFGPDPVTAEPLEWTRHRSVAAAAPDWVLSTEAVEFLAPLDPGHRALVDQAIEGPDRFERKREVIDQFGWRHFGEIYGDHEAIGHTGSQPLVSHYNNQYDPVAGFALQFLRTGDTRWWSAMNELAGHVIDIDIYHTDRDKSAYNGGLFWHTYHYGDADTATHRTYPKKNTGTVSGGGPSADHNYPTGLMLHYFLTGDEASRQAAIGLARYVMNLEDWRLTPFRWLSRSDTGRAIFTPPDFTGPARSSGNSLNALVDGHRLTGDPAFLGKADTLVRRVVHPADDMKKDRLDEPEYRWFYAMFLQALGKYLAHKAQLGQIDAAYAHGHASLLAYARWMAAHEYPYLERPEKLEYPTETWAAQDIRKSDILYHAAMHATGAERERFIERAGFFHHTSIETLAAMPTRTLARPVIVLLTSGFLRSWFVRHPDASLPQAAIEGDPGKPARFVTQRAEATRRAKLILAAGAVGFVLLVVVAVLLMFA